MSTVLLYFFGFILALCFQLYESQYPPKTQRDIATCFALSSIWPLGAILYLLHYRKELSYLIVDNFNLVKEEPELNTNYEVGFLSSPTYGDVDPLEGDLGREG